MVFEQELEDRYFSQCSPKGLSVPIMGLLLDSIFQTYKAHPWHCCNSSQVIYVSPFHTPPVVSHLTYCSSLPLAYLLPCLLASNPFCKWNKNKIQTYNSWSSPSSHESYQWYSITSRIKTKMINMTFVWAGVASSDPFPALSTYLTPNSLPLHPAE